MLRVPASVRPSNIHGLGLFADAPIKKGTHVWVFDSTFDLVFDPSFVESMPLLQKNQVYYYAYLSKQSGKYVFSGDDYRFINHSSNNNLDSLPEENQPEWVDVANRDIATGEELLVNYVSFDAEPPKHIDF